MSTPYYVDALLPSGRPKWGSQTAGTAAVVSYGFSETAPVYASAADRRGFQPMNASQRNAVRSALALWAEVANIGFVEVGDAGTMRFATNSQSASAAYAYLPGTSGAAGDVYLDNTYAPNTNPLPGGYGYATILHEIGHAIGLKHPGDYGDDEGPFLPAAEDSTRYTLMSYYDHPTMVGVDPVAPALYDIAAVQHLYGANLATRTGDDRYAPSAATAGLLTIWDAGGNDTLDASGQSLAALIDLAAGSFSSVGPYGSGRATDNVAIAYGVTIENATGGSGNDTILGNAVDNLLVGNDGSDLLRGGSGDDVLLGNRGNDVLLGNTGGDVLFGGGGDDVVFGGGGGDRLWGDDGNDTIWGDSGSDVLTGGAGADVFVFASPSGGGETDVVLDFTGAAGDRIAIAAGTGYSLAAGASEAVIVFSNGGQVLLSGLPTEQFGSAWIITI